MRLHVGARITLTLLFFSCTALFSTEAAPSAPEAQKQAWDVLLEGMDSSKASQRALAIEAISLMARDRRATRSALLALHDKDPHVRTAAAATLGQLHAESAIPALRGALQDQEVTVVLAAAHSLFLLKDRSAYEIYYAILMGDRKSSQGLLQSQANRLKDPRQLAKMGFEEGIGFVPFGGMGYQAYREIRSSNSAPVRGLAARFLARDPDRITEDALIQVAVADKSTMVRLAALDALAERGDPSCAERLTKNLSDEKPEVRYRTAAAILHLSSIRPKAPRTGP